MSLERDLAARGSALVFAAYVLLASPSAWATSGEVGRTPACMHPKSMAAGTSPASRVPRAKAAISPESVIEGLIGAGATAWNVTLGGIMPAPDLLLKRVQPT